jgi:hypothetical protein
MMTSTVTWSQLTTVSCMLCLVLNSFLLLFGSAISSSIFVPERSQGLFYV